MTMGKVLVLLLSALWRAPQASGQSIHLGAQVGTLSLASATTGQRQLNGITTNGRDRVLVSVAATRELLVFTADGRLLSRSSLLSDHVGNPGAMAFLSPTTFAVMDRGRPYVLWARLKDDSAIVVAGGAAEVGATGGACSLNGTFVVAGFEGTPEKSHILHEVNLPGPVVRSFGTPLGGTEWAARLMLAPSLITCASARGEVVIASQMSGEIRAITTQGSVRWTFTPPHFTAMTYQSPTSREMRYVFPADSLWDMVETIFAPAPGVVAFQITHLYGTQADSALSVSTYFLDSQTGQLISTQSDLPLVRAVLPGRLYTTGKAVRAGSLDVHHFKWGAP